MGGVKKATKKFLKKVKHESTKVARRKGQLPPKNSKAKVPMIFRKKRTESQKFKSAKERFERKQEKGGDNDGEEEAEDEEEEDEYMVFGEDGGYLNEEDAERLQDIDPGLDEELDEDAEMDVVAAHRRELEELKQNDPDFYQHLLQNDPDLLEFDEEDAVEEDQESDEFQVPKDQSGLFLSLKEKLKKSNATWKEVDAMVSLLKKATDAVKATSQKKRGKKKSEEVESSESKRERMFWVNHRDMYQQLVTFGVSELPRLMLKLAGLKSSGELQDLSKSANWEDQERTFKRYTTSVTTFLLNTPEEKMIRYTLGKFDNNLSSFIVAFEPVIRNLFKFCFTLWSTSEHHSLRVDAFLFVRSIVARVVGTKFQPLIVNLTFKLSYMFYMRTTHLVSPQRWPEIQFMINSLVELYSLEPSIGYKFAFVYLRQLATNLRSAILHPKEQSKVIHGWQFMNSLRLWTAVVTSPICSDLKPLTYPLTQIVSGLLHHSSVNRFLPCRLWCVRLLQQLSVAGNCYIPYANELMACLDSKCLKISAVEENSKKQKQSNIKAIELKYLLKSSSAVLANSRATQESVLEEIFELLKQFFLIHYRSISFPELCFPIVKELNSDAMKHHSSGKVQKLAKSLAGQLKLHCEWIEKRRSGVKFTPQEIGKLHNFLSEEEASKCPLKVMFTSKKRTEEQQKEIKAMESLSINRTLKAGEGDEQEMLDEAVPEDLEELEEDNVEGDKDVSMEDVLEDFVLEELDDEE